jgi:hypothetical protein
LGRQEKMNLSSYPKIYAIGHKAIEDLFKDDVMVEEKVDGSMLCFAKAENDLFFRSKGAVIYANAPEKMFTLGVEAVKSIMDRLHEGWIYRGEYLSKPKHNTLSYARVPRNNVILFDVTIGTETYLSRSEKEIEAERIGLEIVPKVFEGRIDNVEFLMSLMDRESILGGEKIEGLVVKNYSRFGKDGSVLMGKYVREDFKERNGANFKRENPSRGDVVQRVIGALKTEARWNKAVQHLREKGQLESSPRDIGNLIKEVKEDMKIEEEEWIKTELYKDSIDSILRGVTAGVAEWYKLELAKGQFKQDT